MRDVRCTFEDREFSKLERLKNSGRKISWHDFIIEMADFLEKNSSRGGKR